MAPVISPIANLLAVAGSHFAANTGAYTANANMATMPSIPFILLPICGVTTI